MPQGSIKNFLFLLVFVPLSAVACWEMQILSEDGSLWKVYDEMSHDEKLELLHSGDLAKSDVDRIITYEAGLNDGERTDAGYLRKIHKVKRWREKVYNKDGTRARDKDGKPKWKNKVKYFYEFFHRDKQGNVRRLRGQERKKVEERVGRRIRRFSNYRKAHGVKQNITNQLPSGWDDVWIAEDSRSHLQFTGRKYSEDGESQLQYLYHPKRDHQAAIRKFDSNVIFGGKLTQIRKQVNEDLRLRGKAIQRGLPKERVLATIVELLDHTYIRVGDKDKSDETGNYGLTALQKEHFKRISVDTNGTTRGMVYFSFPGKKGVEHTYPKQVPLSSITVLQALNDLRGDDMFRYIDEKGRVKHITYEDVKSYIREIGGESITPKYFRTWGGTFETAYALAQMDVPKTEAQKQETWEDALEAASKELWNRPTEVEESYADPVLKQVLFENPERIQELFEPLRGRPRNSELSDVEQRLLDLLREYH